MRTKITRLVLVGIWVVNLSCGTGTQSEEGIITSTSDLNGVGHDSIFRPQEFKGRFKPVVSVLGTFHFTNSESHDYRDAYAVDGLSSLRQKELEVLIARLKRFGPTKILIERNRIAYDSLIQRQYLHYKDGDSLFQRNDEVYLIAFPLAKQLGHTKVFAADATADWFGADLDWAHFDEEHYLKSRNQFKKSQRYDYETTYRKEDSLKSVLSILDFYKLINTPKAQKYNHQIYLTETVLSGAGDNYIGADAVARWYRRNLRIFSNTLDLVDFDTQERILIIYGASHIWTLKQFFQDSPDFEYVEINTFLYP